MKLAVLLLAVGIPAFAQTAITATITDSDSATWNNGTWSASLVSAPNPVGCTTAKNLSGTMSGVGVISTSLCDNSLVTPFGSYWRFTICPNASASCSQVSVAVSGASQNLSTVLSNGVTAPRFAASPSSYGYLDVEVTPIPKPGGTYFNVTTPAFRQWNGSAWTTPGGGVTITSPNSSLNIGGTPTAPTLDINLANPNAFTAAQTITTSGASGSNLILISTNGSNQANIDFQSSGGSEFQIADGSSGFGAAYLYVFDKTFNVSSLAVGANQVTTGVAGVIGWTSNTNAPFPPDTGISRDAANVIDMGNGSSADKSATVKAAHYFAGANEVTVTAASTTNQAICLKSAGPPVVLGTCSTVVSSSGACTCN